MKAATRKSTRLVVLPQQQPSLSLAQQSAPPDRGPLITDPDLVDRIFEFVLDQIPELADRTVTIKEAIRQEYGGDEHYVRRIDETPTQRAARLAREVRRMFDGRNATEVARVLRISRATVYRCLKSTPVRG